MEPGAVGMQGYAPIVTQGVAPPITEQRKYERMWERAEYRAYAPGEAMAATFLRVAHPPEGASCIDFGAGTGRGAFLLALQGSLNVTMLDFAANCLDADIQAMLPHQEKMFRFRQHDLTKPVPVSAQFGYCTDVMEHIPTADVMQVLVNVLQAAQHVFFQISCEDDSCGKLIGHTLHHTVQPFAWWLDKLNKLNCLVHWSEDNGSHCLFYVSAWQQGKDFTEHGVLNTTEQQVLDNMRANLEASWKEVEPHEQNDFEVILLAGGPSLNDHVETIKQLREGGAKLITVNGTYQWAIDHGLTPSAQIIVDARAHNARFVKPVLDTCVYLMASQVHPSVLDGLPHARTYLWHTSGEAAREVIAAQRTKWYTIHGGSSVVLRAFSLLLVLGYHKFHVFGFDSCLRERAHHAYAQAENDGQMEIAVTCGDRIFYAHPWMISQAAEFQDLVKVIGDHVDMELYGDGLIKHMVRTGCDAEEEKEFQME